MVIYEFESKVYTEFKKWIVNVMHDVWDMFVNDRKWWSRHSIFRKGDTVLRLLGCVLFGDLI